MSQWYMIESTGDLVYNFKRLIDDILSEIWAKWQQNIRGVILIE